MLPLNGVRDTGRHVYCAVICPFATHLSMALLRAPATPVALISLPTLVRVGSASGKHWQEFGEWEEGQSQVCLLPPSLRFRHLQLGL